MTVVENSEEWQFKNLSILLEQTVTPPTDLLVLLIACFIPPESKNSLNSISISADNEFSPLRTSIFSRRNLFIRNVNKCINRPKHFNTTNDYAELFPGDLLLIL